MNSKKNKYRLDLSLQETKGLFLSAQRRTCHEPAENGRANETNTQISQREAKKKKNNKERKKEKKCLHQGFNTGAYGHTQVTMLHSTYHNASGYVTSYPCFF